MGDRAGGFGLGLGGIGGGGWALEANGPVWFAGLSSPYLFKTLPKTEKQRKKGREKK